MPPAKLDLYAVHKSDYVAPKTPILINVKPARYLAITGKGEPGGEAFQTRLGALYAVAFTIKMAKKFAGRDYKVCGLEGLWWGMPKTWNWKLIIRTPDFITPADLKTAVATLRAKGKGREVSEVKLERIEEGPSVQMLHVGPYDAEAPTLKAMEDFAAAQGLKCHGRHHEIYLSDPRRVKPEKLRTILRMPVKQRATRTGSARR